MAEKAEASTTVPVHIESNPDAELFLIAGDFSLAANNVGSMTTRQPPGLYKIRAIRSGLTREEVVEIGAAGLDKKFKIDDIPTVAPSRRWPEDEKRAFLHYVAGLNAAPLSMTEGSGEPAKVFIFASDMTASAVTPLRGLRVYPWRRVEDARALARLRKDFVTAGGGRWAGLRVNTATPLVLEIAVDGRVARQIVPLLRGRETHVYLRRRKFIAGAVEIATSMRNRMEWLDIVLEFPDDPREYSNVESRLNVATGDLFPVDEDAPERMHEAVVAALGRGRRLILNRDAIMTLLRDKFADPYIGVAGAHLMLEAIEKRRERMARGKPLTTIAAAEFPDSLVDEVCDNLRRLFGYGGKQTIDDPDLLAVLLRADKFEGDQAKITTPPLYRASWDFLLRRAARDDRVWIEPRLWRELEASTFWGAYLAWAPQRISVKRLVDRTLSADRSVKDKAETESSPEAAALSMRADSESRDAPLADQAKNLAERLRLPLSLTKEVERALGKRVDMK